MFHLLIQLDIVKTLIVFSGPEKLKAHMQSAHCPPETTPILVEDNKPAAKAEAVVAEAPAAAAAASVPVKADPVLLATDEDSQSSFTAGSGLQPSIPSTSSGRVSAGSSIDEVSKGPPLRGSTEGIKCALCTETFADSAALQAHTLINHTSEHLQV